LLAAAFLCLVATAALGPSAAEAPLGRHDGGATPPLHVSAAPPDWLVTLLPALAVVFGAAALALVLLGRWRPPPARLAGVGIAAVAVLALLPPVGSADPLSYASYGRMVVTGHNPYTTKPAALAAHDPVAAAVETPWQHEPSVYGPLATGEQAVAAAVGGADPARVVFVLDLVGALVFVAVGLLLLRTATDDAARLRAAALWSANPLLWLQMVAGGHLDVLVALAALAAVLASRRRPVVGAGLAGVAGIIKPTGALVWLAIAWPARRSLRRLALLALPAGAVVVAAYAVVGTPAVRQLGRAGRRVSHGTPWRPVLDHLHTPRGVISALALVVAAVLAVVIARRRGGTSVPLVAVAVTMAYVLAAPYALPWYDALPWALLPLVAASWRDWPLLAHTTVLSLAYLPGRDAVALHGVLQQLTSGMRSVLAPVLLTVLLAAVVVVGRSAASRREAPAGNAGGGGI
jgi:alpha-1,6-mannosyltransferase